MTLEDIMAFIGILLSIDTPPEVKDRYFLVLFRELARENRKAAEAQGIGKDSRLTMPPKNVRTSTWQAFSPP